MPGGLVVLVDKRLCGIDRHENQLLHLPGHVMLIDAWVLEVCVLVWVCVRAEFVVEAEEHSAAAVPVHENVCSMQVVGWGDARDVLLCAGAGGDALHCIGLLVKVVCVEQSGAPSEPVVPPLVAPSEDGCSVAPAPSEVVGWRWQGWFVSE